MKDAASLELAYQVERAQAIQARATDPRTLQRYRRNRHWKLYRTEFIYRALGELRGRSLLDFGCGGGIDSVVYAALGAEVTGIDISPDLIEIARRRAQLDGVRVEYLVGDLLQLDFPVERGGSPDEHPLSPEELAFLRAQLGNHSIEYFDLLGRFGRFFQGRLLHLLLLLDRAVLALWPALAGSVVIAARR